jgi:hypothetical protein
MRRTAGEARSAHDGDVHRLGRAFIDDPEPCRVRSCSVTNNGTVPLDGAHCQAYCSGPWPTTSRAAKRTPYPVSEKLTPGRVHALEETSVMIVLSA